MPRLQPLEQHQEEEQNIKEEEPEEEEVVKEKKNRKTSGPKVQDPYELEDGSSHLYPLFVAIGLFVPTVLCLCKL